MATSLWVGLLLLCLSNETRLDELRMFLFDASFRLREDRESSALWASDISWKSCTAVADHALVNARTQDEISLTHIESGKGQFRR